MTGRRRSVFAALLSVFVLTASGTPPAAAAAGGPGTLGKVAGYGITSGNGGTRSVLTPGEAGRMAATGANTVMLDATWQVTDQSSNTISRGAKTVPDSELRVAAEKARSVGMSVMLTVKLVCEGCSNRWRGSLTPSDPRTFFLGSGSSPGAPGSYLHMSNYYAELAREIGAVAYFVGSEMSSTQGQTELWRTIVLEARKRFSGQNRLLGYHVNWDSMREVDFWDDLDVAGLSTYFPLTDAVQPNLADLLAAWRSSETGEPWQGTDWYSEVEAFAASHGKPVLFGEVGYQSANQAAQRPWQQEKTDAYDAQLQADAYQALLTMFQDRPWWLGALWWEWVSLADEGDLGYSPRDKLAEELLTKWYAGQRPSSREQSLVGASRPSAKGAAVPAESQQGPSSPSGRTTVSRPVAAPAPAPETTAPQAPSSAPAVPPSAAPPVAPESPALANGSPSTSGDRAPELAPALRDVQAQSVEQTLLRADERARYRQATLGAAAALLVALLGHALLTVPQVLRRTTGSRGRRTP